MGCDRLISVSILKAFEHGGCLICRLIKEAEVGWIRGVLYEGVNDPGVGKGFLSSGGLLGGLHSSWATR